MILIQSRLFRGFGKRPPTGSSCGGVKEQYKISCRTYPGRDANDCLVGDYILKYRSAQSLDTKLQWKGFERISEKACAPIDPR